MAIKLSKKALYLVIASTVLLGLSLSIYFIATANTKSSTVAILDHAATLLLSNNKPTHLARRHAKAQDSEGRACSRTKGTSTRSQVGIFTDLCEVLTGRSDGCFYRHPEIVHFVKLTESPGVLELSFQDFISILSVHRFYKPEKIIIHSNAKKVAGSYWALVKQFDTPIKLEYADRIRAMGDRVTYKITHEADILKVKTMLAEGGIFMDFDAVILNGTQLRATQRIAECVMGADTDPCTRLCAGFVSCTPNSSFVEAWWKSYQENYVPYMWVYNAGTVPSNILRNCTNCYDVFVDRTISNINTAHRKLWLKKDGVDWKRKVVAHYMHSNDITPNGLLTDLANTSISDMFLHILGDYLPAVLTKVV